MNAPASRTFENCRTWAEAGHDVTVVTCAPNHPAGRLYPGYRNRLWHEEQYAGIRVIRLWTWLAANQGFALRTANYLSYFASVLLQSGRLPQSDVIVSTSPQFFCGLAGLAARGRKRPWVLEIRDLWPESITTVGAMRKGVVTGALEALERFAYGAADGIVSVTDSFVPHIAQRGGAGKVSVVKNGVDLALFDDAAADGEAFKRSVGLGGKFVAAYVGTHGMAHGLDTVLNAAGLMRDDPRVAFLFVGDGAERARLEARASAMGLTNVTLLGQRPKSDMPAVWAATDASLVLLRKAETFTKVIPSKMFEAMAMRRAMVLGVEGEARALMEAAGAGVAIPPEDAPALAAAVRRLADDPAGAKAMGDSGRAYVSENFDRRVLAHRYLDILARVAGIEAAQPPALSTIAAS